MRGLLMIGLAGAAMTVAGSGQAQVVETASAERRGTQQHGASSAVAVAAPLLGSIRIDGHLDEEAWSAATPITSFTQMDPNEGAQPTQRTEVRILIGGDALYVGARMYETDPSRIRARLARRDESVDGDVIAIYLDSRHDHLSAYYFRVTAGGAMRDAVVNERGGLDLSWDAVWDAAVTVDSLGWIAEMRIPLSQLPYTREGEGVWGLQIDRYRWNDQERSVFAYTPRTETQGPPRYGHLRGLGELPAPTRIELVPYVTARGEHLTVADDNPFRSGRDLFANAGVDLRYRVTPGLTLNATVNPDFGQVEVDPAVVNLSAYETFLPERRPFFVEGRQLFTFASNRSFNTSSTPTLFFSRRIGRPPQRFLGGMQHVEAPDQSTIAAATKLTGRTGGGWSLGLLQALTLKESAEFVATDDARGSLPVEPMTNYLVGRVRREMAGGNTIVGGFASGVHRDLSDEVLTDLLRRSAYVGGVDLNHSWDNRRWAFDAALAMSRVEGSESAMSLTQRSSARYFQRPDASSFSFDPSQTSLQGHYGQLSLTRTSGEHWLGSITYQETSPGFEVNDLGFQSHADRRAFSTLIGRQETRPNSWSRNHVFVAFTNHSWNHDGDALSANYSVLTEVSMLNFWRFELRGTYIDEVFNDRLTRGGPLTLRPRGYEAGINVSSDPRNPVQGFLWSNYSRNDAGAARTSGGLSLSYQPSSTVRLMLEPNLTIDHNPAQYVFAAGDPLMPATYDRRYIFADLEQRELALVTRVDWTFSPRMSLQVFIQPLVASGAFSGFKELAAPRTFDFNEYGVDVGTIDRTNGVYTIDPDGDAGTDNALVFGDPDFNFRSLRGNAVLRWEYRPGSTLFFVWQQRRSGSEAFGDFNFGRDYGAIFSAKPENVFAIKATYWITR